MFSPGPNEGKPLPGEIFVIVNVTIANTGFGNASISSGFVQVAGSGFAPVTNTNWVMNATFPGEYPNRAYPDISGGVNLPPGAALDTWLLFYVPYATANNLGGLYLQFFWYRETSYGGNYIGHGGYDCRYDKCQATLVQMIFPMNNSK